MIERWTENEREMLWNRSNVWGKLPSKRRLFRQNKNMLSMRTRLFIESFIKDSGQVKSTIYPCLISLKTPFWCIHVRFRIWSVYPFPTQLTLTAWKDCWSLCVPLSSGKSKLAKSRLRSGWRMFTLFACCNITSWPNDSFWSLLGSVIQFCLDFIHRGFSDLYSHLGNFNYHVI